VTEVLAVAGALLAWLGSSLLTLSDGRRGAALGLAAAGAGLAVAAAAGGRDPLGAAALAAGGACGAVGRLRGAPASWGVLTTGSTPRLIATVVVVLAAAVVAGSAAGTPAGAARLGALVVAVLAAGRILTVGRRWAALAAGSALALGLGALGDTTALVTGGLVAAVVGLIDGAGLAESTE
jgi:hypothetical protein